MVNWMMSPEAYDKDYEELMELLNETEEEK
jgi:hypothetical protein